MVRQAHHERTALRQAQGEREIEDEKILWHNSSSKCYHISVFQRTHSALAKQEKHK